ncbi:MAG TPA: ABC transporter permease [Pseudonocardiaceae bacterium]|nr:ABC transporter permease [Pseudonocardiaceae bacterium]
MSAPTIDRLGLVLELARQLARRPTSNEVRELLRCGRPAANTLLAELDALGPHPDRQAGPVDRDRTEGTAGGPTPPAHPWAPAPDLDRATSPQADPSGPHTNSGTAQVAVVGALGDDPAPSHGADAGQDTTERTEGSGPVRSWPVILLALPAFVAIWSGWVGLGALTGFGPVHPLPGIAGGFTLNSAITLPVGVETYAAYALRVWLTPGMSERARRFARTSAIGALVLGAAGQVAYHLMTAAHLTVAPWPITTAVACLPVVVLGFGAALAHLQHDR